MEDGHRRRRASRVTIFSLLGLAIVASAFSTLTPAAAQSNIQVFVGYADKVRAEATNFPTPWLGSPRTTFEGCAPVADCTYDAGAIRVVNNSAGAVTVDAIAVHIATCTYINWPMPVRLGAGADLIVTQLTTGEARGCTGPTPDIFDTSDIGVGGGSNVGVCSNDHIYPTVDVTIDGTTTPYTDSAQVLNTGGIDPGSCPGLGNESTQWLVIGTGPCPGPESVLTLAPPTQTDPVLSNATITAHFTNSCGQGLSNTAVSFNTVAGVNNPLSGSGVTNANGDASFTYSSQKVGTDTWDSTIATVAGNLTSNTVLVNWTVSFAPGGGAFVISDLKDVSHGAVYWWGAQWWKNDQLKSHLTPPPSFKGFADNVPMAWCGNSWSTRPGNSSRPPKAVAANSYMAVIVASRVTKRGAVISGNIVHIVLVRTNAGYGPNPGHPGTGTIVLTLC